MLQRERKLPVAAPSGSCGRRCPGWWQRTRPGSRTAILPANIMVEATGESYQDFDRQGGRQLSAADLEGRAPADRSGRRGRCRPPPAASSDPAVYGAGAAERRQGRRPAGRRLRLRPDLLRPAGRPSPIEQAASAISEFHGRIEGRPAEVDRPTIPEPLDDIITRCLNPTRTLAKPPRSSRRPSAG
jgi:hypothetical protein